MPSLRLRALLSHLVAWAPFALVAPARAQLPTPAATPEQVQLRFAAGSGCPTEAAFANEVAGRVRRPVEWVTSNPAVLLAVALRQDDHRAAGTLEVTRRAMEPARREFVAETCAEVGSALALVAALALDPNARTEPLAAPTLGETELAPPAPAGAPPAPVIAAREALPVPRPQPPPVARPPAPSATSYRGWIGPVAGASAGYAPGPLGSAGVSLGVRARPSRGLSPSVQLTPWWGKTGSTGPSSPDGSFAWTLGRIEACPTEFLIGTSLALAACAAVEAGRLSARGSGRDVVPLTAERWWLAAGVTTSLHLSLGAWFARLGGHVLFPATRDEFVFRAPDKSVHEASAMVSGATLAIGFEFGR